MREITKQELKQILDDHKIWLNNSSEGKKADLRSADLSYANLSSADLRSANLSSADLHHADLSSANLRCANLSSANLRYANLRSADLRYVNLLTFQYQQHQAYCTGERLIIGCLDKPLAEWVSDFEEIGKAQGYTDLQIEMYGVFISMCVEHASTLDEEGDV